MNMNMNMYQAINGRRSIRRFKPNPVPRPDLIKLVDCARVAPYAANLQPLKFLVVQSPELLDQVFTCTKWAGYLEDGAPKEGERPTAYIVMLGDTTIKKSGTFGIDVGAAGTSITLAAVGLELGSCWLGALDRPRLKEILDLPEHLEIQDIIALGYPAQKSRTTGFTNSVKYYMDDEGTLQVPKRSMKEVLISVL